MIFFLIIFLEKTKDTISGDDLSGTSAERFVMNHLWLCFIRYVSEQSNKW